MIKFRELKEKKQIEIANVFCDYLLQFFGKEYMTTEALQKDFKEFLKNDHAPEILADFGMRDIDIEILLDWKRWKVCEECGRPFISIDYRGVSKFCKRQLYVRFTKLGEAFKMTDAKSICWMKNNARLSKKYLNKRKDA